MRITRSRTAASPSQSQSQSQGSTNPSVQESTTSSAHARARRREPERRGRVRRGGSAQSRADDGLCGPGEGRNAGEEEGPRALLGPLPIVEPRRDGLNLSTAGKRGTQQDHTGPTTSTHVWATIPADEHLDPQEETARCAKDTALVQQLAQGRDQRDTNRAGQDGGDESRWIVDRGPEVWYLDPLIHARLARTWRIARAPPLTSALDLSALGEQTPAERVPVGRNLADWVSGPSFPALPPDVLPTTLRLPALPSPLALLPPIPSPHSGSGSGLKSTPRSLLRAATAPHPSPRSYQQSQDSHTPDLPASLVVGATTHQTISPAARAVLPPGELRGWAARRRVERAIIARSEVRGAVPLTDEDWTSEDLQPWEWEPRRGRGVRAAPEQAPQGTAGGTSTWAEGITSILPSRSLPGTSPPPLAPVLDARGRPLAPIPRAPLALSSSTAALLAKRKAPTALQETRGRGKKRERGKLKVKEQHGAGEGGRAMEVLRGRLPTFRLSNGSADGQPVSAEDGLREAAAAGTDAAVMADTLGRVARRDATIAFNSPQAESTQIAQQRNAAGPTAGDASAWRDLQLTPAEDDSIQSIGQEEIGGAADFLDANEAEAAMEDAQDALPVPLDPAEQRRASMRRAMRQDKTYLSIMDAFPELASPVPPPRTRSGQRKARQHIAKAAAIDPRAVAHPLHPGLGALEEARPYTRVCWYIPVHGPAYVPDLPASHQPASARARADPNEDDTANTLLWTEADLLECWTLLKRMQELQRFGPMRLVVSPPSPDPFRPAPAPLPQHHRHIAPEPVDDRANRPQRLEIGTHIRLYCDLEWARRVRTALSVLPFPGKAGEDSARRLLHGVRLTLVGDMGEVLAVI